MLVAMANHVLNSSSSSSSSSSPSSSSSSSPSSSSSSLSFSYNPLVVCFNEEAKEGDRGRVAVLDKVMIADES